jgi:alanine dehydrogenase
MIVGVPREIKSDEYRVSLIPVGVEELTRVGHQVLVQTGAGQGSGIADERYIASGAEIVPDSADIWKRSDLIVKVKEPMREEWPLMQLTNKGVERACKENNGLLLGVNIHRGRVTNQAVAQTFNLELMPVF